MDDTNKAMALQFVTMVNCFDAAVLGLMHVSIARCVARMPDELSGMALTIDVFKDFVDPKTLLGRRYSVKFELMLRDQIVVDSMVMDYGLDYNLDLVNADMNTRVTRLLHAMSHELDVDMDLTVIESSQPFDNNEPAAVTLREAYVAASKATNETCNCELCAIQATMVATVKQFEADQYSKEIMNRPLVNAFVNIVKLVDEHDLIVPFDKALPHINVLIDRRIVINDLDDIDMSGSSDIATASLLELLLMVIDDVVKAAEETPIIN